MNRLSRVPDPAPAPSPTTVALVTLGCARNEVDSEELAGRLEAGGFLLVDDAADAETVVVNTCGFVEAAKKDSVDTLLAAADLKDGGRTTQAVVAVGCLAERYGAELADSLPEADAVLGFDDYPDIADRLAVDPGRRAAAPAHPARTGARCCRSRPRRARRLRPGATSPADARPAAAARARRLDGGPMAPLKLASGCDRRCTFCAIPAFRGSFVSRRPSDVLAEARWLAGEGVRELFLVSENSTSYGKDLGDLRLLETLLPELAARRRRRAGAGLLPAAGRDPARPGRRRSPRPRGRAVLRPVLPARLRPRCCAGCGASATPRRFLGAARPDPRARRRRPGAARNFIVGFPGETEDDLESSSDFLTEARLDAIGVFGYSDEDGTEADGVRRTSSTRTRSPSGSSTSPRSPRS